MKNIFTATSILISVLIFPGYILAGNCCVRPSKVDSPRTIPEDIERVSHPRTAIETGESSVPSYRLERPDPDADTESKSTPSPIMSPMAEPVTTNIPIGDNFLMQNPAFIPSSSTTTATPTPPSPSSN